MGFLSEMSIPQLRWGLRRLYWGLPREDLVLEVGSGGNPCPRSDVLVDYSLAEHEGSRELVADRPTFLCAVESLPFKDKQFDFVISFHSLEHSKNPEAYLNELERVAKAGYIETPSSTHEMFFPYKFHRSLVSVENGRLKIKRKSRWDEPFSEHEREELNSELTSTKEFLRFYRRHPRLFTTQYYWKDAINYELEGIPGEWRNTKKYDKYAHHLSGYSIKAKLRKMVPEIIRKIMRYSRRKIEIANLLKCARCGHKEVFEIKSLDHSDYKCQQCGSVIKEQGNIFFSENFIDQTAICQNDY